MPNEGDTTTLYDKRDGQAYTVGKLADGKYWMLEDLNLAGGTALDSVNTDVTDEYISGFTEGGNLTKSGNSIVLPASATKNDNDANLTDSSQFSNNSNAYVFNSGNNTSTCNSSTPCNSYYSWIAATLGGKDSTGTTAVTSQNTDAAASICPKGWRLPNSRNIVAGNSDFYQLAINYGMSSSSTSQSTSNFYNQAGPGTLPNFLLAGYYSSGSFYSGGSLGFYWSATSYDSTRAYLLYFYSSSVYSTDNVNRSRGALVRCLLSE